MKKLVGIILIVLVVVPWPWLGAPLLAPHLQGTMPPEQIEFMAPIILAYTVYPLLGLIALITLGPMALRDKKRARARGEGKVTPGHGSLAPPTKAERREREKRKKRSQEEGALLMAFAMLDDNKKK